MNAAYARAGTRHVGSDAVPETRVPSWQRRSVSPGRGSRSVHVDSRPNEDPSARLGMYQAAEASQVSHANRSFGRSPLGGRQAQGGNQPGIFSDGERPARTQPNHRIEHGVGRRVDRSDRDPDARPQRRGTPTRRNTPPGPAARAAGKPSQPPDGQPARRDPTREDGLVSWRAAGCRSAISWKRHPRWRSAHARGGAVLSHGSGAVPPRDRLGSSPASIISTSTSISRARSVGWVRITQIHRGLWVTVDLPLRSRGAR